MSFVCSVWQTTSASINRHTHLVLLYLHPFFLLFARPFHTCIHKFVPTCGNNVLPGEQGRGERGGGIRGMMGVSGSGKKGEEGEVGEVSG